MEGEEEGEGVEGGGRQRGWREGVEGGDRGRAWNKASNLCSVGPSNQTGVKSSFLTCGHLTWE